ncbi:MAG: hypothetical protein ACLR9R_14995 [Faecalibacterium prausnitzii]
MKMAKKFLAVALAGVLALSVLTGCANGVKSKDVADSLTKMGIKVEQSKDLDKTAKSTLTAIEAIVDASAKDSSVTAENKITLDNAVKADGKVVKTNGFENADTGKKVQKALGMFTEAGATDAEKANAGKQVRVALVEIKNAKKDASLQAALVKDRLVTANAADVTNNKTVVEPGKLGTATTKDGKYILVVIVNDVKDAG